MQKDKAVGKNRPAMDGAIQCQFGGVGVIKECHCMAAAPGDGGE